MEIRLATLEDAPLLAALNKFVQSVHQPPTPFMHAIDHFIVEHIAVAPGWRRRGVGQALLSAAREGALERELDLMTLSVWAFNAPAHDFFASAGYQPYSIRMWQPAVGRSLGKDARLAGIAGNGEE